MANGCNWNWWKTDPNYTSDIIEDMISYYARFGTWPGEGDLQWIRHLETPRDWLTHFVSYREALHEAMALHALREATAERLGQFQERSEKTGGHEEALLEQDDTVHVAGVEKTSAVKNETVKATVADAGEISSAIVCGFYEAALEADLAARM